jgi:hemoglobin
VSGGTSLFEALGGEPGVRALVDAFYDRMDREPAYALIRGLHPADLAGSRDKLFWFLCGWTGGPQHFQERFGHPRLKMRHFLFAIGIAERDQWLHCMAGALLQCRIDESLAGVLMQHFAGTADWMRNRPEPGTAQ